MSSVAQNLFFYSHIFRLNFPQEKVFRFSSTFSSVEPLNFAVNVTLNKAYESSRNIVTKKYRSGHRSQECLKIIQDSAGG